MQCVMMHRLDVGHGKKKGYDGVVGSQRIRTLGFRDAKPGQ